MRLVVSERARSYIAERGGKVWVWLDPHRGIVGSYVWLEAHAEAPGSSRRSKFTRASRRPHRFHRLETEGVELHFDFGGMDPPDELHLDRKGWRKGSQRLEAYWNGVVFAGEDIPPPASTT